MPLATMALLHVRIEPTPTRVRTPEDVAPKNYTIRDTWIYILVLHTRSWFAEDSSSENLCLKPES